MNRNRDVEIDIPISNYMIDVTSSRNDVFKKENCKNIVDEIKAYATYESSIDDIIKKG